MNAIDLLEKQHRMVESLFKRFEDADDAEKGEIFEEIASNLVAHDAIEREIFYPACERALEDEDTIRESLVEHGVVEFCVFRADQNRKRAELEQYVKVLKEIVQHHVDEEEKELLPKVKRAMDGDALDTLGERMEARFEAAMASDFRRPLRANLQQVLAGRTRTTTTARRGQKRRTAKPQRQTRGASARRRDAHAR